MIYALFGAIAIASALIIGFVGSRKGVVDIGKFNIYKPCEDNITPFKGKTLILLTTICVAVSFGLQISLYKNTSVVNFIKLYSLFVLVTAAGVVDLKRRIIPNILIIFGLGLRLCVYIYEIVTAENIKAILFNDLIGFAIGFLLLAVVAVITKGALGFGDVKLFGVIGITGGAFVTYSTLLLSLIISAVFSLVALAAKKMSRKDSFPFGPCITAGYIIAILLKSY